MPSARSASPSASPSGAGSRASTWSAPSTSATAAPMRRTACAISTPDGPAAEHEQPARDLGQPGDLAVRPHAVQLAQARDRRDHGVRAGGDHDVLGGVLASPSTSTAARPGEPRRAPQHVDARCPRARRPGRVVVVRDHEVAPLERGCGVELARHGLARRRAPRAPPAAPRRGAAASSTGCRPSSRTRRPRARARRWPPSARRRPAGRRSAGRRGRRRGRSHRSCRPPWRPPSGRAWAARATLNAHLAECPPVDRRLASRNIRTALIAGVLCFLVFAASFLVAFVY